MSADEIAYPLPAEPLPIRLMNTIWADRDGRHDDLDAPQGLGEWLRRSGFTIGSTVDSEDLHAFRRLRDALRRIAAHVTDDQRPAAASATEDLDTAIADLNSVAVARTPLLVRRGTDLALDWTTSAHGAEHVLSLLGLAAAHLFTEDAVTLRACHGRGCVLYFSKDHPRRGWCSPGCSNRARAARHYQRHRSTKPE
ncbi:CGNR zinc finger domain-containing protein [Allokutzneria oryzae]|uniref:CGNR zinc finger domain-containing protein n=1 Tax=Allokutzneria oryzae TaxID=1378989 RepID=A0ABV5ZXQ1_9PSEU